MIRVGGSVILQPRMDERQLHAGRVLVAGFPAGPAPAPLMRLARQGALGGFILFRRNVESCEQLSALNAELLSAFPGERAPLLAVDQEGGRVRRIGPPLLQLPAMRSLGKLDDPELTAQLHRTLAGQLRALGFNVNMAPVLDVDSNPNNPVIGDRSFGTTAEHVIRHGRAAIEGLQSRGVAACGKHFPGHGDTDTDSHLALPRLPHERERLERVELAPFRALAHEAAAMMSSHIVFDALAPGMPATLAKSAIHNLLRDELGFGGLIFSDDMEMKAISHRYPPEESAILAIEAGCDALLLCSDVERTLAIHEALVHRAETDTNFAARLSEASARVQTLGERFRCRVPTAEVVSASLSDPAAQRLSDELTRRLRGAGLV